MLNIDAASVLNFEGVDLVGHDWVPIREYSISEYLKQFERKTAVSCNPHILKKNEVNHVLSAIKHQI